MREIPANYKGRLTWIKPPETETSKLATSPARRYQETSAFRSPIAMSWTMSFLEDSE